MSTSTITNPRDEGLALALDLGTRKSHSIAQNSAFVTGFFKGLSTKESFRALVTSLYFVYDAMETVFDEADSEAVKSLDDMELRRTESLQRDLRYFYGDDWESLIRPSPATVQYVKRVQEIAQESPKLLVAHQYTRYLGDLFGGQMMGGMATKSLKLEDGGVDFYTFEDIPQVTEYITDWYTRLNQLQLTEQEKMDIVDEANLVFDLNIGLLSELEGSATAAIWTLAWRSLKEKLGPAQKK